MCRAIETTWYPLSFALPYLPTSTGALACWLQEYAEYRRLLDDMVDFVKRT